MITSYFPKYVALFAICVLCVGALDTFVAAVYEHAVILPNRTETPVSKEEALLLMNKNIDVLENAVKLAARQGAHIIVTPEDGIYGWVFTRETIYPYLEDIPDPEVNWIPCTDPQRFGYTPVQQRLSCLAKDNSIYVVANIGDKKPCNASDPQCPPDGRYQYNTDVVFDSEGRLVARYHKYNLFAPEIQFDFPKDSESVTFETPFGKFGIFTCFDIFSHTPAVVVVDEFQVDSVLYPVAWYNTLPLLSAVPFHSAWARAMRVNLLAANTHNTSMHMTGSGIYAPEAVKVYHYDMETESGQLMLSELKSRPRSEPTYPVAVDWSAYARSVKPFLSEQSNFPGMIYFDELTFIELKRNTGNYTVCQKDLCCHLTYKMSEKRTDEVYALGAFDGLHTVEGQYYLQICTLLKCQISDLRTCGEPVGSAFTKLEEFSLSGTFATRYVFPQIILSGSQLAPERHYEVLRDGRLRSRSRTPLPVLVLALYGRVFDKDPPRLGQGPRRLE
ncbi:vascular non-inflammatory molecule 3 [Lynx canadensis]|uniref:Vascular non-inflammatory molecule 3 n=1 Tax=Lynx canadensis TaxID=61383 RepID=A0A667GLU6_LYNCA|nr:vascular non-inflammatory molecule 3 [Lynx canadensis]XP_030172237.1 vascular non-inflammatory molecule 3 [Lynx canadensis]XP_032449144.1 vascular non-inflammatory molecule 3 [Lynx canadensis]